MLQIFEGTFEFLVYWLSSFINGVKFDADICFSRNWGSGALLENLLTPGTKGGDVDDSELPL
jgi:hypothetical protein